MMSPLRLIEDAARCAERAAETCQRVEVVQGGDDYLTVAEWQDVADMLAHAAKSLTDPGPDRWYWSTTAVNAGTLTICLTATLLWVQNPQRPLVLAAIVVMCTVTAATVQQAAAVAWTAWTRRRGAADTDAWNPTATVADLRSKITDIKVSLATRLSDRELQAAHRIELAEGRLDHLERRVTSNARRTERRPTARMIRLDPSWTDTMRATAHDAAPRSGAGSSEQAQHGPDDEPLPAGR